jgi:hypothetical protein
MQISESKSLLAKLMATENLHVEQRAVQTASFDVEKRVLIIPKLDENISGYLYDLFIAHEVGHALYTPKDGLKSAFDEGLQAVANMVEDARIERKIKNKYPGIRSSFVRGYKELLEKDFFGTKGADLNDLGILDRLNLFFKGGPTQGIVFNTQERVLVDAIDKTQSYEDVLEVARMIGIYAKEEREKKRAKMLEEGIEEIEEESYELDFDDNDDYEDEYDLDPSSSDENSDSDPQVEKKENRDFKSGYGGSETSQDDGEIRSLTDEEFKKNQTKLFAEKGSEYYYGNLPKLNMEKVIWKYKNVYADFRNFEPELAELVTHSTSFAKIRKETNKVVSYLAKEFEMRKNAEQSKRASIAKTGELDMSKIYSYKFSEDIFRKMTVIPGGKSHGLIMFIDWSGSMSNHLENTVKQLISLTMFCKKVSIPYEVYAFSSETPDNYNQEKIEGDIDIGRFRLINFLSSKMTASEYSYGCNLLLKLSNNRYYRSSLFGLGGTPLNEAVLAAMEIVPAFQKSYKLQVVNTVFLTDGEGHSWRNVFVKRTDGYITSTDSDSYQPGVYIPRSQKQMIIRDPVTKSQEILDSYSFGIKSTSTMVKLLKERTGCNVVGFYVLAGREMNRTRDYFPKTADFDAIKLKFRKEKTLVVTTAGFDEYYFLRSEGLDTEDDVEFDVKENVTRRGLVSAFSKYTKNRVMNRVVLNRFIGMIA